MADLVLLIEDQLQKRSAQDRKVAQPRRDDALDGVGGSPARLAAT